MTKRMTKLQIRVGRRVGPADSALFEADEHSLDDCARLARRVVRSSRHGGRYARPTGDVPHLLLGHPLPYRKHVRRRTAAPANERNEGGRNSKYETAEPICARGYARCVEEVVVRERVAGALGLESTSDLIDPGRRHLHVERRAKKPGRPVAGMRLFWFS